VSPDVPARSRVRRALSLLIAALIAVVPLTAAAVRPATPQPADAVGFPGDPERQLIQRYCVSCHNQRLKIAGLTLDTLDVTDVSTARETWEKVVRKLRAGAMPPANAPRPEKAVYEHLTASVEAALDRVAAAHPRPGRIEPFHRLNRAEYQNAVRDLLGVDVDVTSMLPPDDASYGFDNIAGVLKVSPTLLERYLSAAQKISRLAVGTAPPFPSVDVFRIQDDFPQDDRLEGLPFGTRGGARIRYTFPMNAEYLIQVRLSRYANNGATEDVPRFAESHDLELSIDDAPVRTFTLAGEPQARAPRTSRRDLDADWQVRIPVQAGPRAVKVTFLKKSSAVDETLRLPFLRPIHYVDGRYEPYLGKVTITGPFDASGPGDTPSRRRVFVCQPRTKSDELPCARKIFSTLARRAYRGPVSDEDLQLLMPFFERGRRAGGFDEGIESGVELLLVSPKFLFRAEHEASERGTARVARIGQLELASRLSFFLWSSIPDDELLDLAMKGTLANPAVLDRQVRRLLADSRSEALVTNFAGQWLFLRNLPTTTPDPRLFPDFDESLRVALRRETELFFDSILRDDRNVMEFLTADYTFVNERLAKHYGILGVTGSDFRRITVTAYPHRTSPVRRGKWILENMLGTPPPPPPPDVPPLDEKQGGADVRSMRERMQQHRANAVCASCHAIMDPPGLALENFDAIGRWRRVDDGYRPIDASGSFADGTTFDGVGGLRHALLSRSDQFVATLAEKLLTYALGRGLEFYDAPAVRGVVRDARANGYRFSSIIVGIVNSLPFQFREMDRDHQ
jgi:uncharacterized protein DUF1592/uncharacterized protein DUF1588/uncharacterized protein DUF1585/uncharacterized protein DUF1587/uncharacterized protein DUF1595